MRVLFATDGSVSALEAERLIDKIADRDRVDITVLSVVPTGFPQVKDLPLMMDPLPSRRDDALALVDAVVERFLAAGFKATGRILEGSPGEEIVDLVEDDWHDLTVVGAGGRNWVGQRLLGSVSSHVLHSTPNSVMLVHSTLPKGENTRVLVCTDGSQGANIALNAYMALADPTRCDTVAMSVEPVPLDDFIPTFPIPPMLDPEVVERLTQEAEERAARHATTAATHLRDNHFTSTEKSMLGHPASSLLDEADGGSYGLVVVGSRGQGPIRRALLGSVSDKLARHTRAALVGRHLRS